MWTYHVERSFARSLTRCHTAAGILCEAVDILAVLLLSGEQTISAGFQP